VRYLLALLLLTSCASKLYNSKQGTDHSIDMTCYFKCDDAEDKDIIRCHRICEDEQ
jgi:hypothetical protein